MKKLKLILPTMLVVIGLGGIFYISQTLQTKDVAPEESSASSAVIELRRGINITNWFMSSDQSMTAFDPGKVEKEIMLLKKLGFDFVRLGIPAKALYDSNSASTLNSGNQRKVTVAIEKLLENDFTVIVTIFDNEHIFENVDVYDTSLIKFWDFFSKELSSLSSTKIVFEFLNEPRLSTWPVVQSDIISKLRDNSIPNVILATNIESSTIDSLIKLSKVNDNKVIYTFHFYEPIAFTHQGFQHATGWEWIAQIYGLAYPYEQANWNEVYGRVNDETALYVLDQYRLENWNNSKITSRITTVDTWRQRVGVQVVMGEFGVICSYLPAESKIAWIRDVRTAAEQRNIPWSLWADDYCFGLDIKLDSEGKIISYRKDIIEALGLKYVEPSIVNSPPTTSATTVASSTLTTTQSTISNTTVSALENCGKYDVTGDRVITLKDISLLSKKGSLSKFELTEIGNCYTKSY